ncbi:MAG: hypothetical protein ACAH21_11330 [Ramlibacter sp.]|nr:hypothetical protein [Ramlibacter sp.]
MLNKFQALGAALLCTSALAQAPAPAPVLGTLVNVKGLVTMSHGTVVTSVADNTPVLAGSRFVASSTGSATLKFNAGCEAELKPNQTLTLDPDFTCEKLAGYIKPVPGMPVAVWAGLAGIGLVVKGDVQTVLGIRSGPTATQTSVGGGGTIPDLPPSEQ